MATLGFTTTSAQTVAYKKIGFIYNPVAFKGQGETVFAEQVKPIIQKYLHDREIVIMPSKNMGGAKDNAKALIEQGCDLVVACGGDGTIHDTVNGIIHPETHKAGCAMAILPMGTGNDFAKAVRLETQVNQVWSHDYDYCIKTIANGFTILADVGRVENSNKEQHFFSNECSFGVSGDVMEAVNAQSSFWISKDFTFQFQTIYKQLTYYNKEVKYTTEQGVEKQVLNQMIAICNGQYFGSGMQVAPKSQLTDGTLNVTVFGDVGFMDMALSIIPALYKGEHGLHPKIAFDTCKTLRAEPKYKDDKIYIEADGELVGCLPATISVLAGVLPLIVPQP